MLEDPSNNRRQHAGDDSGWNQQQGGHRRGLATHVLQIDGRRQKVGSYKHADEENRDIGESEIALGKQSQRNQWFKVGRTSMQAGLRPLRL